MTEQDVQDLKDLQAELLAVDSSAWQPGCVSGAFASLRRPFEFTMQVWIDLDAVKSPFLLGKLPEAEAAMAAFDAAFVAFGHFGTTPESCQPDELILLGQKMIRTIAGEFSMRVRLQPPEGSKVSGGQNGLGDWLPILACLKSQLHFTLAEALSLRVGQAFALIAAHRCNEGWSVAGESYATRDIPQEDSDNG